MASFQARAFEAFFRAIGAKAIVNNGIDIFYPVDSTHAKPSLRLRLKHHVTTREFMGRKVYTITPKSGASTLQLYYLHGGAYYNGFLPPHWYFLNDVVTKTRCTVTAPDFPLAPDATPDDIYAMVMPLYRELLAHGAENLTVMGDSSGGGMALVVAQKARDTGLAQPKNLVLLSPWLDVTMTNPGIIEADRKDPYLGLHACIEAGKRYAKSLDPKRPDISPIYGSLAGLGPISLFVGTHDIMIPDCRKFRTLASDAGVILKHVEYPDMVHDWMMLKFPESEQARNEICTVMTQ